MSRWTRGALASALALAAAVTVAAALHQEAGAPAAADPVELVSLEGSLAPLEQYFNENRGRLKVMVLVAPT